MNDITQALQKAGVKIPSQQQRIWQYLRDYGPATTKDLAGELKIGSATVQAAVTVMVRRKMLEKIERKNHLNVRINNHYGALGKVFEVKPEPKSGGAGRAVANAKREEPVAKEAPVSFFDPAVLLEALTLSQARQVYTYLGRLFK